MLGGLNYCVLASKNKLLCSYCIAKTRLLLLRWDTVGKVRDRFGGMGRFKSGLR